MDGGITSRFSQKSSDAERRRRRDVFELSFVYGLILLVLWTPRPWQTVVWGVVGASILAILCLSFDGLKPMGLCTTNLLPSLWAIPVALALAAAAIFLAGSFHTLQLPESPVLFVRHYGAYALWALAQQLVLQCLFLSRLARLLSNRTSAAAVAAVLFATAHLPSPILTILTLIWGLAACLFFLRYRNLYPLAIAHAILGIAIGVTIPAPVDHNMRVGLRYLTYAETPAASPQSSQP